MSQGEPMDILSESESWSLLSGMALGRLVTSVEGQPEIFPVNFVVQDRTVLFRTAEGAKLFTVVMNSRVAFEADDHNVSEGWSVIVKGRAEVLNTDAPRSKKRNEHSCCPGRQRRSVATFAWFHR